jgi:transcriptional regulator with XRE-family HTH domain
MAETINIYQKIFFNSRLHLKISLRNLASKLGVAHSLLSRIENGKQTPSLALVNKLTLLTGFTISDLASGNFAANKSWEARPTETLKFIKKMEANFSELTGSQRGYLRDKWSAEIKEFKDAKADANLKLNKRIEKSNLSEGEISVLVTEVEDSKSILTHLQNTGAADTIIAKQQAIVTLNENRLTEKKLKSGTLSDEEAVLEQVAIDELDWKIQYRETKIAQINAIV